ncbi:hypothetical protein ACEPAF_6870 [Sanghuangporus sanghuang]
MSNESDTPEPEKISKIKTGKERRKGAGKGVFDQSNKKSKPKTDVEILHGNSVDSTVPEVRKEKRKRKHDKLDDGAIETVAEDTTNKKKKKHKKRKGDDDSDANSGVVVEPDTHKNKAKSKEDSSKPEDNAQNDGEATVTKKRMSDKGSRKQSKKSHKKDSDTSSSPNPRDDTTLSDKGREALSYAFTSFASPNSWKFNKAHQNWIVRHFFSLDAIPDIYVSVVVKYLTGCQGGVRQNLIQACNKHLEVPASSQDPDPATFSSPPDSAKLAGQPAVTDGSMDSPRPPNGALSARPQEDIKVRADTLLKALAGGGAMS